MSAIFKLFFIFSFLIINPLFGQEETHFETSTEYLAFLEKKFKIEPSEVYYLSTESDSLSGKLEKIDILLLITNHQIATINEIANNMGIQCMPKKLMPKITESDIMNASDPSEFLKHVVLKNMTDGARFNVDDQKVALYMFSYRFGKSGTLFLKEKKSLEQLGYKTVVLSIDGAYIKNIFDIDKTPVYVK